MIWRALLTMLFAVLLVPAPALAVPECPSDDHRAEMSAFEERLRGAADVDEAREMALKKVDRTKRAVDRAAKIVPDDPQLLEHQAEFEQLTYDIEQANSKQQVAASFADLDGRTVGSKCDYSTGEIVAIVIGFVLGIIPGIILLIVFC